MLISFLSNEPEKGVYVGNTTRGQRAEARHEVAAFLKKQGFMQLQVTRKVREQK